EVELAWIPLADGTQLAARLFLPVSSDRQPVPVILEYLPYRRRDTNRRRDNLVHYWFAQHGFATAKVDIRGTGDSEGVIKDEYLKQEQDDGLEVITWLAKQPWCTGKVGMFGISWGGFNSLQIAARRPPELKAIMTLCASDDRYADDMHYMGGGLLLDTMRWGIAFFNWMARSPDPLMVGDRWRTMWKERLDQWEPPFLEWIRHQARDDYWKQGSVCEDYSDIQCAVFAVGGWADGYSNSIPRMLANLNCPRLGLIGPWPHVTPIPTLKPNPGPAIGYLQEAKRWWDHWLKDIDTGIMEEPMLRTLIQDSVVPAPGYENRSGYWVGEPTWPSPNIRQEAYLFGKNTLSLPARAASSEAGDLSLCISSPQTVGQRGGEWCGFGVASLPLDQREDDAGSLLFDSDPLTEPLTLLGAPTVQFEVESDQPQALLVVRLSDVQPDGAVRRISYGILNLSHRDGHETPVPLEPGKRYNVRLQLNDLGEELPAGHRIRVAVSTSYWPVVWPSPQPVRLTIHTARSKLTLPVRSSRQQVDDKVKFDTPVDGRQTERTLVREPRHEREVVYDVMTNQMTYKVVSDEGSYITHETGIETSSRRTCNYTIKSDDPLSARAALEEVLVHRHDNGWDICIETHAVLSATSDEFLVEATLKATDAGKPFHLQSWLERIPRNGV
ncbi:CocE/NonD family hydrolase, partial [Mesorhizobium sp.]|uniref:CocE/NonD family hydrolase n=1 Tax=Mesorhizobium sp. TaxID=1871066 RepID=UPI0025DA3BC2